MLPLDVAAIELGDDLRHRDPHVSQVGAQGHYEPVDGTSHISEIGRESGALERKAQT